MAAKIIKGTNLNVGDLPSCRTLLLAPPHRSHLHTRLRPVLAALLEAVHADMATRITGQQKMFELFQEEGVEVKYRH